MHCNLTPHIRQANMRPAPDVLVRGSIEERKKLVAPDFVSVFSNTVYFRWEHAGKSGEELILNAAADTRVFPVRAYTLGYLRDLSHGNRLDIGLGAQFTINDRPGTLDRYYGDGLEFFLRIRPSLHNRVGPKMSSNTRNGEIVAQRRERHLDAIICFNLTAGNPF
jgi:hypothetical protein